MIDVRLLGVSVQDFAIQMARKGDGRALAALIREFRRDGKPLPPLLLEFFEQVAIGKIRLPPPRKQNYLAKARKWMPEKLVARRVEAEMRLQGKQRDKDLRTFLTRKYCKVFETTPPRVADYLRTSRRRRRA